MEAARSRLTTTTGKRKVRASNALQRKPLADRTNAPPSQSSPIPKPLNVRAAESADDYATTGSIYTRRKCRSGRSASLVARSVKKKKKKKEVGGNPPSMLSMSLKEPPRKKLLKFLEAAAGIKRCIATRLYREAESLFCRDDAFDLPVEVASSDELD